LLLIPSMPKASGAMLSLCQPMPARFWDSWISLLDSYGISYVCWNLSNKDEKSALLTPACDKTSGFTYEDLSDEGKWLYGVLTSHVTPVLN